MLPKKKPKRRRTAVWIAAVAATLSAIILLFAFSPRKVVPEARLTRWDPRWPLIPASKRPAHSDEIIQDAYAFAANREDIVRYIPCYCGCERTDHHQSLHDCFVRGHDRDGTPQWDPMGYT